MEFDPVDTDSFIEEIKNTPCIWNHKSDVYLDKYTRAAAWTALCQKFTEDYDTLTKVQKMEVERKLQRKWKTLRDGFNRDLAYKRNKSRGKLGMRRKQYLYFKQLSFLLPLADARIKPEDLKMSDSSKEEEEEAPVQIKPKIIIKRKRKPVSEGDDSAEEFYTEQKSYKTRKQIRKRNTSQLNTTLTQSSTEHDKEQLSPPLDFDVDKYFLLSLHWDFKNIPEEYKIDAKSEIIEVIRKYKQRDPIRYQANAVTVERADSNNVQVQQLKYEYDSNEELISSSD